MSRRDRAPNGLSDNRSASVTRRTPAAASIETLSADHIAAIVELAPEIVLLGTGPAFRFPDAARLAPLYKAGIGVEVMDTPAACRTYNILLGEGRNVVAALIL